MDKIAWVLGASGFWGQKVSLSLLRRGWQVTALNRRKPEELLAWAEAQERICRWQPFDLRQPDLDVLEQLPPPQAVFQCAAAFDADLGVMMQVNAVGPILVMETLIPNLETGRIGVFLGQNGRLGIPGLGRYSATQGALWTWAEAQQRALKQEKSTTTLSLVFPPRAPSDLQRQLAQQLSKPPRVKLPDNADALVEGVLNGKRRVGRKPLVAGLSTLIT